VGITHRKRRDMKNTSYDSVDEDVQTIPDPNGRGWIREILLDSNGPITIGEHSRTGNYCLKVRMEPIQPDVVQFLRDHYEKPIATAALDAIQDAILVEVIKDAIH
jgi:hypothetical protein